MNEKLRAPIMSILTLATLYALSFFGFSREQKLQAIRERGNNCERCGKTGLPLFAHHILPKVNGGGDDSVNLLLVCSSCHEILDQEAIRKGNLANGLLIEDVKTDLPELIGDWDKYEKALKRLGKGKKK